jgi:hypothetical protein
VYGEHVSAATTGQWLNKVDEAFFAAMMLAVAFQKNSERVV